MLANLRMVYKVLILVGLMAAIAAGIAATGTIGLRALVKDVSAVNLAGTEALQGARANRLAVTMNRAEFRIAASPTPETIADATRIAEASRQEFEQVIVALRSTADREQARLLDQIDTTYRAYIAEYRDTVEKARQLGSQVSLGDAQREIAASALASRERADSLIAAVAAFYQLADTAAETTAARAQSDGQWFVSVMLAVAIIGVLGGIAIGWLIGRAQISRPIERSVGRLKTLAEGDVDAAIPGEGRKDEVGDIAATMAVFRQNLIRTREMQAAMARQEEEAKAERRKLMIASADQFEADVGGVVKAVAAAATEMEATATSMAAGAEETSRQATSVAAGAEQASANVQTVASAAEELAASIAEISRQVTESTRIASEAVSEASRTNATVEQLASSAQRIGEVVRLINDIAGQTNLLALNATIEAARAGEAGKGFAVVASEVKNLASQTAKATEEIGGQIAAVQGETGRVVEAIRAIGGTIEKISGIAASIAAAVEQQGAATAEIARNVQQAAAGTGAVSANIGSVQDAASGSGAAAAQVQGAAAELSRGAETLRSQVERFLTEMKAA